MTGTPQQQLRDLYLKMQGAKLQKKKRGKENFSVNFEAIISIKSKEMWREDKAHLIQSAKLNISAYCLPARF
jgi:hypothetical protein